MLLEMFNHSTASHLPPTPSPPSFLAKTPHTSEAYACVRVLAIYTFMCGH